MRFLIIDNGTSYLPQLQTLLSGHTVEILPFGSVRADTEKKYDAVILSGGHLFPVIGNEELLQKEIELIQNYKGNIFGICFGFELIAHIFGAAMTYLGKKEDGILTMTVAHDNPLFKGISTFTVFEKHRWVVTEVPEEILVLAHSQDGIEAIRHRDRPIYGVQFHPEMFPDRTCGDEIFSNFLKIIQ